MDFRGVIKFILLSIVAILPLSLQAQFVMSGGTPASQKWFSAEGATYKVIYPQGADSMAKKYLWHLEQNKEAVMLGMGGIEPVRIPAVLYNSSVKSNGMVVWAPKRMELFTMPFANHSPQMWDQQLAVHESRHVGQMTHFTKGIFRLASYVIGEQAPSLGVGIYPSRWFLEGDAVVAETELSNSGRGRSAEFMEYYRAAFLEGDLRNWSRWKLGSYRYYTPNMYAMGYLINSTIRYRTGKYQYGGEILSGYVKNFYNPFVVNRNYGAVVGGNPRKFFKDGRQMLTSMWKEEQQRRGMFTEGVPMLLHRERGYQEYRYPMPAGKDSVLYVKYSYNSPQELVLVSSGREKSLAGLSSSSTGFTLHNGIIYYVEDICDSRWSNVVYSRLYSYNLKSGKREKLSGRSYYGSPQVSPSGDTLMVEEYFPDGGSALAFLDSRSGEHLGRMLPPAGGDFLESVWFRGKIYALAVTPDGLGLFSAEVQHDGEGDWDKVIEEQPATIEELRSTEDFLYFVSDADGVRNVYSFDPQNSTIKRITNGKYAATDAAMSGDTLYYSQLEMDGRFPVKIAADAAAGAGSSFDPYMLGNKLKTTYRYVVADELTRQAAQALQERGLLSETAQQDGQWSSSIVKYAQMEEDFVNGIEAKPYSKGAHMFRFHSWAPVYYNVDRILEADYSKLYEVAALGATAYSQNTLGTAVTMLGYSYHDGLHAGHLKFKYSGWYPSIQISADVNSDNRYMVRIVKDREGVRQNVEKVASPLVKTSALVYVPLDFSGGGWYRSLVPQLNWDFDNNGYYSNRKGKYLYSNSVALALQYSQVRERGYAQIFPEWGFGGIAKWRKAVAGEENFGSEASVQLYGYMPGFAPKQGIKLQIAAQKQNVDGKNYFMGNMVDMPRGYSDEIYSENYCMLSADYALPVYMGDILIWKLAYVKRMQILPFVDYAMCRKVNFGNGELANPKLYSYGAAVMFDFSPFTIGAEVSFGVRYSRTGSDMALPLGKNAFDVVISTSLL